METIIGSIGATLLGLIAGLIAENKGRSLMLWWFLGFLCPIVVIPISCFLSYKGDAFDAKMLRDGNKKCLFCSEWVRSEAKICKHCRTAFNQEPV